MATPHFPESAPLLWTKQKTQACFIYSCVSCLIPFIIFLLLQYAFPSIFSAAAGPITSRTIPSVFWARTLWLEERKKAQNKQAFPDAADTAHPQSGCSKMVLQRAPSKNTTATGSVSAPQPGGPPTQFPTRTIPELNSAKSAPQELSTSKKEIKGTPQVKMDFTAFIHNVRRCFSLTLKVLSGRDLWPAMQFYCSVSHCRCLDQDPFLLIQAFIRRDGARVSGHFQST